MRGLDRVPQLRMTRKHAATGLRQRGKWCGLASQQMVKESRRPSHGLAGVVQNVVEPWQALEQVAREQLDARCVPQIEAVNLQTLAERRKIPFLGVALGGVDGESARDHDVRAGSQQFQ